MAADRKIPPIFRETHLVDATSLVRLAFLALAALVAAFTASRLGESNQDFQWVLANWFFVIAGTGLTGIFIKEVLEQLSIRRKRKAWLAQSLPARLEIVDRKRFYDEYIAETEYSLTLRLSHIPGLEPCESELLVRVGREIFDKYRELGHVQIHFCREDPYLFIIDEEERA